MKFLKRLNLQSVLLMAISATALVVCAIFLNARTVFTAPSEATSPIETTPKTVPQLSISLQDTTLDEINSGSKFTIYEGNHLTVTLDQTTFDFDNLKIKGRGNSTWVQPKKPYQIEFAEKINLFGLGGAKKWVLLANYLDPSNLRNAVDLHLADLLDEKYAVRGQFVDLYADNEYIGLYYLTNKVKIGDGNVRLSDRLGILMEIENIRSNPSEDEAFSTLSHDRLIVSDTVSAKESDIALAKSEFMNAYNQLEATAIAHDFAAVAELIDVDSFAKYFLISEITLNPDAYSTSCYFYKNGPYDTIHAGPAWDFDLAFNNQNWGEATKYPHATSPDTFLAFKTDRMEPSRYQAVSRLYYNLMDIPEFSARVAAIYNEHIAGHSVEILDFIGSTALSIESSARADVAKWHSAIDSTDSIDELIDWLTRRFAYLDQLFSSNS